MPCRTKLTARLRRAGFMTVSFSPNRSSISCTIAVIAAASSGPLVSSRIVLPMLAASIITARMLRAFARRPFEDQRDAAAKARRKLHDLSLHARACRPKRFLIPISRVCMIETPVAVEE